MLPSGGHLRDTRLDYQGDMKLVAAIIENLWGVSLPVEQLAPLAGHALAMLVRFGR